MLGTTWSWWSFLWVNINVSEFQQGPQCQSKHPVFLFLFLAIFHHFLCPLLPPGLHLNLILPEQCRGEGEGVNCLGSPLSPALSYPSFFFILFYLTTLSHRSRLHVQPPPACSLHMDCVFSACRNLVHLPCCLASSLALLHRWPFSSLCLSSSINSRS